MGIKVAKMHSDY